VMPGETTPLGDQPLDNFTTHRLEAIYQHLRNSNSSRGKPFEPETARKLVLRITTVCEAAHRTWKDKAGSPKLIHMPLRPQMAKGQPRTRVVQPYEEDMIFDAIQHLRETSAPGGDWWAFGRLIAWSILHGTRIGETVYIGPNIVFDAIDPDTREAHMVVKLDPRMTKGGTGGRTIMIHDSFLPLVDALNGRAQPTALKKIVNGVWFHDNAPRWFPMTAGKAWTMWDIMRDWVKANKGHDLGKGTDGLTLHNLRHTCATRLIEADVDLLDVSHRLGHKDVKITQVYVHASQTSERRIRNQIRKFPTGTFASEKLAANERV